MSSSVIVVPKGGGFDLMDLSFAPDEVAPAFERYALAKEASDADHEAGRYDHQDRWTGPAVQRAADELREAVAPRFDNLADLIKFRDRLNTAIAAAAQAELAAGTEAGR